MSDTLPSVYLAFKVFQHVNSFHTRLRTRVHTHKREATDVAEDARLRFEKRARSTIYDALKRNKSFPQVKTGAGLPSLDTPWNLPSCDGRQCNIPFTHYGPCPLADEKQVTRTRTRQKERSSPAWAATAVKHDLVDDVKTKYSSLEKVSMHELFPVLLKLETAIAAFEHLRRQGSVLDEKHVLLELLCHQLRLRLIEVMVAKAFDLFQRKLIATKNQWRQVHQFGQEWWSEYPGNQHPLSTTWPWSIRPSLAVLWGVCWMFYAFGPDTIVPVAQHQEIPSHPQGNFAPQQQSDSGRRHAQLGYTGTLPLQALWPATWPPESIVPALDGSSLFRHAAPPHCADANPSPMRTPANQDPDSWLPNPAPCLHGVPGSVAHGVSAISNIRGSPQNVLSDFVTAGASHPTDTSGAAAAASYNILGPLATAYAPAAWSNLPFDLDFVLDGDDLVTDLASTTTQQQPAVSTTSLPSQVTHASVPSFQFTVVPPNHVESSSLHALVQAPSLRASAPFIFSTLDGTPCDFFPTTSTNSIDSPFDAPSLPQDPSASASSPWNSAYLMNTTATQTPASPVSMTSDNDPPLKSTSSVAHFSPRRPSNASTDEPSSVNGSDDLSSRSMDDEDDEDEDAEDVEISEVFPAKPHVDHGKPHRNADGKIICVYSPECRSRIFERRCEWSKHMDAHTRPYKCQVPACEKLQGFTYWGGLLRHRREVHRRTSGPALFCPAQDCKRSSGRHFSRRENLNEHIRRAHPGLQPLPGTSPTSGPSSHSHSHSPSAHGVTTIEQASATLATKAKRKRDVLDSDRVDGFEQHQPKTRQPPSGVISAPRLPLPSMEHNPPQIPSIASLVPEEHDYAHPRSATSLTRDTPIPATPLSAATLPSPLHMDSPPKADPFDISGEMHRLKRENTSLRHELQSLRRENTGMRSDFAGLRNELANMKEQLSRVNTMRSDTSSESSFRPFAPGGGVLSGNNGGVSRSPSGLTYKQEEGRA